MKKMLGPPVPAPLSLGVAVGDFIFLSGQIPKGANGRAPDGIDAQTRVVLENLATLLDEAGSSLDKVVKTTVFLTDPADFGAFNAVYAEYFPEAPPARSTILCDLLVDAKVEIEAIAFL